MSAWVSAIFFFWGGGGGGEEGFRTLELGGSPRVYTAIFVDVAVHLF